MRTRIDSMYFSGVRPDRVVGNVAYLGAVVLGVIDENESGWVMVRPFEHHVPPRMVWINSP